MIDAIINWGFLIGAVLTFWPAVCNGAHAFADGEDPAGLDWTLGLVLGIVIAVFWWAVAAVLVLLVISRGIWTGRWGLPFDLRFRNGARARDRDDHEVIDVGPGGGPER